MNLRRTLPSALALVLAASSARANDTADEADLQFELGNTAYRDRNFLAALEHFLASNRLVPNRNVVYNVARAYEQLSRYADAHRYYTQALEGETDASARDGIRQALARIAPSVAGLVAAVRVKVGDEVEAGQILIEQDGRDAEAQIVVQEANVGAIQASLVESEVVLADRQDQWSRVEQLGASKVVSVDEKQRTLYAFRAAASRVESRKSDLAAARAFLLALLRRRLVLLDDGAAHPRHELRLLQPQPFDFL
jgi:biotin carboxyl carrier protein